MAANSDSGLSIGGDKMCNFQTCSKWRALWHWLQYNQCPSCSRCVTTTVMLNNTMMTQQPTGSSRSKSEIILITGINCNRSIQNRAMPQTWGAPWEFRRLSKIHGVEKILGHIRKHQKPQFNLQPKQFSLQSESVHTKSAIASYWSCCKPQ